jgi:sigma-B regulation protein RsbU (phosphoserine phosphatase)
VVITAKGHAVMKAGAPALGLTPKSRYREQALSLKKGDALLVYSDGITDARNEQGAHFDETRLMALMPKLAGLDAAGMGRTVVSAVDRFVGEARPNDDLSLLILRRTG